LLRAEKQGGRNVEYQTVCDCDHDQSGHDGVGCKECADAWSLNGACRAGGFTNSQIRQLALQQFWNLHSSGGPDCIRPVADDVEAESQPAEMPIEMLMDLAIESAEETKQEGGLSYASHHG
jgi:hypothetical protein